MPEHYKIAAKAVKRIDKSGRLVLLKKIMAKPGKAITAKWNYNKPKPFTGNNAQDNANKN